MKKNYFLLLAFVTCFSSIFSQATFYVEAPPFDNGTSANRAPNGTVAHSYMRACALVLQSELTGIVPNSTITSFGFTLNTGTNLTAVAGNFTLYLENTNDVAYTKSATYATAITGMTQVYGSVMTVPTTATSSSITITLSTPFTYTGGALYVAYDWASTGPFDLTAAVYRCNYLGLVGGCATGASSSSAPATLGSTNFRPCFLFGVANTFTNDIQLLGTEAPGRVATILNTPHVIKTIVKNGSNMTQNNIAVNLNVGGANPFTNTQTIPTLTSGAVTTVTFAPFNPMIPGANTISVSVASDQNNTNNQNTYSQSVTCNEWAQNPATGSYTNEVGFGVGSGIIASSFLNPVTSTLTGLRCAISTNTPAIGNQTWGVLLNATGGVIATTNTITISNAMLGTFQTLSFASAQNLTAATPYYFGFAQPANTTAYYPAGALNTPYIPATAYVTTLINGGTLTPLIQNLGYFGIEAIFGHTANVSVASTASAICTGTCVDLTALGTTNYTWSIGSTSPSITICPTITTTYSVIASNTAGCNSSAVITVTVNQLPNVTAAASKTAVCLGGTVALSSTGAATYSWNPGPTTSTFVDSPLQTTTYSVTGISAQGCVNSNTVDVIVNSFTPGITSSTAICDGASIPLTASGGTIYNWSTLSPFPSITVNPSVTTVYSVTSTGTNGCVGTNETTVTVNANPTITATAQRTVMCKGETNTLTAAGANTYSWSTNSTNTTVIITPTSNITFTYLATGYNLAGCSHTALVSVKVDACTGIAEIDEDISNIHLFPNPTDGFVFLHIDNSSNTSINVYNAVGGLIKQESVVKPDTSIDIRNETSGIYFIHVLKDNVLRKTFKIIKN